MVFAPWIAIVSLFRKKSTSQTPPVLNPPPVLMGDVQHDLRYSGASHGLMMPSRNGDRYFPESVYSSSSPTGPSDRSDAVVTMTIHPNRLGQVKFRGSWWSARCGRSLTLEKGTLVNVVGRDNITLIVEPMGFQSSMDGTASSGTSDHF